MKHEGKSKEKISVFKRKEWKNHSKKQEIRVQKKP
ncbi:uncharacterized protein METZ01_LOCUS394995 [marine metagenome]|uniref:Uncharacterized protein n=1 Tax=marine metagenome TaxID=408172 RepID=A0A382V8C1_9ZZZZ